MVGKNLLKIIKRNYYQTESANNLLVTTEFQTSI